MADSLRKSIDDTAAFIAREQALFSAQHEQSENLAAKHEALAGSEALACRRIKSHAGSRWCATPREQVAGLSGEARVRVRLGDKSAI